MMCSDVSSKEIQEAIDYIGQSPYKDVKALSDRDAMSLVDSIFSDLRKNNLGRDELFCEAFKNKLIRNKINNEVKRELAFEEIRGTSFTKTFEIPMTSEISKKLLVDADSMDIGVGELIGQILIRHYY